jgi:hypothetical protein
VALTEFCWLVELFLPDGGNSLGFYHTGFTDLSGNSRSTKDPFQAKRYATKAEAEAVATKLGSTLQGVWRPVEHGFDTHPAAPSDAPAQQPIAFVPLHPANGPLWSETFDAKRDASEARPKSYPLMALYGAQPAQQAVAPGWKLVPEEPTSDMLHAGECYVGEGIMADDHSEDIARSTWKAMLSAAPAHPSHQPPAALAPTNEQWFRACKEIIDRCVAPDMYGNARALLDRALREASESTHPQADQQAAQVGAPKAGEKWHFKLPNAAALSTAVIEEITPLTVQFESGIYAVKGNRWERSEIVFVERVDAAAEGKPE